MKAEELAKLLDVLKDRGLLPRVQQLKSAGNGIELLMWPEMPKAEEPSPEELQREYVRAQYGAA